MTLKGRTPVGWVTVAENVEHPDHPNVTGDLCYHTEEHKYQILEYVPKVDNYVAYAVPHAWAVTYDPRMQAAAREAECKACGFIGVTVTDGQCGQCRRAAIQQAAIAAVSEALAR